MLSVTQRIETVSQPIPYLYIADPNHINRDQKGRQLLYQDVYITSDNGTFGVYDKASDELIESIVIKQNADGVDVENRVLKLKDYLSSRE